MSTERKSYFCSDSTPADSAVGNLELLQQLNFHFAGRTCTGKSPSIECRFLEGDKYHIYYSARGIIFLDAS